MKTTLTNIWQFYADGFRNMTWGRNLWLIILIKLFIMFCVLRIFFFPDYLDRAAADTGKEEYVSRELIRRASHTGTADVP